jgi:hypothetical protein
MGSGSIVLKHRTTSSPLIRPAVKAETEVNATHVHQNAFFFVKTSMLFPVVKGEELLNDLTHGGMEASIDAGGTVD